MRPGMQQALERAATALGQGDLATAETLCRRLLDAEPSLVDALNLLSLVRKRQGDAAAAESLMKQALALDARRPDIRGNLANLYRGLKRSAEAETEYRRALALASGFRAARLGLAQLMLDAGRADDALEEAGKLTAMDPADAEAWNVAGSACRLLGRNDEAERSFRRALASAPGYGVARHNLGALLASESRSEEALTELDRAASAGIRGEEIIHNRAAALMALGRLDETDELLQSALAAMPRAVALQMLLARLRHMRGDGGFADLLADAVSRYPDDPVLRVAYSRMLRGAERLDAALETISSGLAANARDPRLLAEMSAVLHNRSDYGAALEVARQAVAAKPDDPALNDLVIQALLSLGAGAEALPLIEAARQRVPLDQFYIALEATAARLAGDPRYEWLYDYDRFVQAFELPVPDGWSSIEDFHRELIPVLAERHRFVAPPLDQSLRSGTQTPRGLLNDPDPRIRAFLEAIREPIKAFREHIGHDAAHPLTSRNHGDVRLSGCWSVRLNREGFHVNHVHSEGWISSAYYVDVPAEVLDADARSGWIKFGEPRFHVPGAGPEKFVQPQAGLLVLFPSYMWHGTTPIRGGEPRMTIAFDAVPAAHME